MTSSNRTDHPKIIKFMRFGKYWRRKLYSNILKVNKIFFIGFFICIILSFQTGTLTEGNLDLAGVSETRGNCNKTK